jgi:hypothetical protein
VGLGGLSWGIDLIKRKGGALMGSNKFVVLIVLLAILYVISLIDLIPDAGERSCRREVKSALGSSSDLTRL